MAIKIQSNINYEQVCKDLGITMETLLSLPNSTQNPNTVSKVSFIEVADAFLENLKMLVKNKKRSKTTLKTYTNFINRIKEYITIEFDSNIPLERFNEQMLYRYFSTLKPRSNARKKRISKRVNKEVNDKIEESEDKGLSKYTINKYIAIIRKLFKFAYTVDYVDKDLSHRFEPDKKVLLPRYFNNEQLRSILKYAYKRTYGYLWNTMIFFMVATGCRISETTNIKIKDINFEENIIFVNGKGDKDRIVILYPENKAKINRYLEITGLTQRDPCNGYLFARDEGNERKIKISDRSLQYQVNNILSDANIDEAHFTTHSFRHTFAVNCLKSNMPIAYLSQLLGHSNPATTSIYLQLLPFDLRDEVMKKYPFPIESLLSEFI